MFGLPSSPVAHPKPYLGHRRLCLRDARIASIIASDDDIDVTVFTLVSTRN